MCVAAAIGGAAVAGAGASIYAGNKAAKAQGKAADAAAAVNREQIVEERRQYDTTRADYAPYREVGYGALGKLAGMYGVAAPGGGAGYGGTGDFETSPGYAFRMAEGQKAIERSAAARGSLGSGGTLKALTRYAQGVASDEYNNYANRLAALAGVGQSATGSTASAGQAMVNGIGAANQGIANAATAAGNARASSFANTGSAINSGVNNLASLYLYQQGGGFGGGSGGFGSGPQGGGAYGISGSDGIY